MNKAIIHKIKNTNDDFEFYPTSMEMLLPIYQQYIVGGASVLDIGCGTCNFKTNFEKWQKSEKVRFEEKEERAYRHAQKTGERYYKTEWSQKPISQYFVIEKSRPLIDILDKDTIVLGTDFHTTNLIDKPVDVIFCNPPYSEYELWAEKIINQGNANNIYLVIPQRWKDCEKITLALKRANLTPRVLGTFDFLKAERAARSVVDVVEIKRDRYANRKSEINERAFDQWFDETFAMESGESDKYKDYERDAKTKEAIKNQLSTTGNKAEILVDLYNQEMAKLFGHFQAICGLDIDVLEAIGIKKDSVKEALKQRLKGLKILYWEMLFGELEEVTSRLTSDTRKSMLERFSSLKLVEFSHDNIYPLVMWVLKNSNAYFNDQLVKFYKQLSDLDNVILFKSNQKTFGKDSWRFRQEGTHYTLDYRIIASHIFKTKSWSSGLDQHHNPVVINDICVIANNLGFVPEAKELRQQPESFGEKYYIKMANGENLLEYKVHKNGNTHIKLNIEFAKAMNVEVSRLLGWIRSKEDIAKEFPENIANGAQKYFKANNCLSLSNLNLQPLLTN